METNRSQTRYRRALGLVYFAERAKIDDRGQGRLPEDSSSAKWRPKGKI